MSDSDTVQEQIIDALRKHNLKISYELSFPRYRVMPDEVRLALSVLKTHGMKITIALDNITKEDKK